MDYKQEFIYRGGEITAVVTTAEPISMEEALLRVQRGEDGVTYTVEPASLHTYFWEAWEE